jgi:hypothetical protein
MVYGIDVVLPINLSHLVMKLWKDSKEEANDVTRRINQLIEVQQNRAKVDEKLQKYQDKMKALFDKKAKDREFIPDDLVLKWDDRKEDVGKHGKFDHIWCGSFRVVASKGKNSFLLENIDGKILNAPINGLLGMCYILCTSCWGLEGGGAPRVGVRGQRPQKFFFGPTYFQDHMILGGFSAHGFLPMVFYFRLRN